MTGHPDLRALRDPDLLAGPERDELLDHVAGCAACRDLLAESDPSRLFALLARTPVPAAVVSRLADRIESPAGRPPGAAAAVSPLRSYASLAASLLLAAALGAYALWTPFGAAEPGTSTIAMVPGLAAANGEKSGGTVRLLSSPGEAQVIDLSVGGTRVTMIFDRELEL